MNEPRWIALEAIHAIHEAQLAEHGGGAGIRDEGLFESALARPQNLYAYLAGQPSRVWLTAGRNSSDPAKRQRSALPGNHLGAPKTLTQLAAAYAVGIAKNHPFVDGNKRTAWVACALFLELNGIPVLSDPREVVVMVLGVADGTITEEQFTAWLNKDHPPASGADCSSV